MTIGANIRQLREERGLSVDELAAIVLPGGICPEWLESVEQGVFGPTQVMLGHLASALRVSVDQLTEE